MLRRCGCVAAWIIVESDRGLVRAGAEAKVCYSRSRTFKGWCYHSINCIAICITEGDTSGFCQAGACMCTYECLNGVVAGGGGGGGQHPSVGSSLRGGAEAKAAVPSV